MSVKHLFIFLIQISATIFFFGLSVSACTLSPFDASAESRGVVTGKVTDSQGRPLEGVKVIVDHSLFYNSNMSTLTNAAGNYRISIPNGSWYAYAVYRKQFNGKTFSFDLEPDNYAGFGGEGAVRNFVWKLTGERQEPLSPGFFGSSITFDNYPTGNYIENERDIDFTLTPIGKLIDGSEGKTLSLRSEDGDQLTNIPLGRYRISASYKGKPLGLRRWNSSDEFVRSAEFDFQPEIVPHCQNCIKLEYYY